MGENVEMHEQDNNVAQFPQDTIAQNGESKGSGFDNRERVATIEAHMQHMATKADVSDLKVSILEAITNLKTDISGLRNSITKIETEMPHKATIAWVLGGVVTGLVAIIGMLFYVLRQLSPLAMQ